MWNDGAPPNVTARLGWWEGATDSTHFIPECGIIGSGQSDCVHNQNASVRPCAFGVAHAGMSHDVVRLSMMVHIEFSVGMDWRITLNDRDAST
jgi:hypothetical protein